MAAGKGGSSPISHECQHKCNPKSHASIPSACLTKISFSDEKVAAYLKWCCVRYSKYWDLEGRNLIHLAASTGRLKLLTFLLRHRNVNINEKDKESHYTALHRSLFYGQLHCAVRLIELGANVHQLDLDDYTPLDHVMEDRPALLVYDTCQPCEVYVWGTNTNYTLGIGHHHSRANPEPLDLFRRQGISIKQVVMSKFHSAFISHDGRLWTCGHGQGGRLGLEDELTTLTPKLVKVGSNSECLLVDLGTDHTILLMANNSVWSFGLNKFHQLGHYPPPEKILSPKVIKSLKDAKIIGISASKYHSVFWSREQLYTCGLNGGQIGHIKGLESTITVPKAVTSLNIKNATIAHVASSDGATVLATDNGEVYLLYEYQCKIVSKRSVFSRIEKISVIGGHLDHKINMESLQEKGGDELKIIILQNSCIHIWQEGIGYASPCELSLRRRINVTDISLNKNFLLLITDNGEAFQGQIKNRKRKPLIDVEKQPSQKGLSGKIEWDYIKLKRIPHIHRGVKITSDLKGRNFAVTQVHPKAGLIHIPYVISTEMCENMRNLFETIGQYDPLHDVTFEVEGQRIMAHRYIVGHSSAVIEEMMKKGIQSNGTCVVKIENVRAEIFRRILCFTYTHDCDLLNEGICPVSIDASVNENEIISSVYGTPDTAYDEVDDEAISAFEYYNKKSSVPKKKSVKIKEKDNPLKLLKAAAKKFEILDLQKKLETVRYDNGYIVRTKDKSAGSNNIRFERKNLQHLWDISLKSEDGIEIKAHKCILVSRLEYFNCMINQGWLESTQKTAIKLPVPEKVLQILLNYLYTDEAPDLVNTENIDLVAMTLVLADQFFCSRLKEFCEFTLANLMNLKNCTEILQMASLYNAEQLKRSSMEFVCLNLTTLLESRSLELLQDEILKELTDFYHTWLPCMNARHISPYHNAPDDSLVDMIFKNQPLPLDTIDEDTPTKGVSKTSKKKSREKRQSGSVRTRKTSSDSFTSEDEPEPLVGFDMSNDEEKDDEEQAWVKVVGHSSKQNKNCHQKLRVPIEPSKLLSQPVQEEKLVRLNKALITEQKENVQSLEKELQLLSFSSEKDFPALNTCPIAKSCSHPPSPRQCHETFKKIVKLSQKQRKRLARHSINENDELPNNIEIKSPWGVTKNESELLVDIMKQESRGYWTNTSSALASSPPWQGTTNPASSLTAVMASERKERELFTRMKSKSLKYTQMEDKAIEDLMQLYNANTATEERITVRRADYEFTSPPIWVSSRK